MNNAGRLLGLIQGSDMGKSKKTAKGHVASKTTKGARCAVETITPAQAEVLLNANTANRPLRQGHLDALARAQSGGRWYLSNDAITITGPSLSNPGLVLNGQHRLYACIESGVAIECMVLYGADPESYVVLDSGIKRGARDAIREQHAATKAAVARMVLAYERGQVTPRSMGYSAAANDEVVKTYRDRPTVGIVVERYLGGLKKIVKSPVGVLAAASVFLSADESGGHTFVQSLIDGEGLQAGPVLALRNRIIADSAQGKARGPAMMVLTLKAWNANRAGANFTRAQLRDDDRAPPIAGYAHNPGTR